MEKHGNHGIKKCNKYVNKKEEEKPLNKNTSSAYM